MNFAQHLKRCVDEKLMPAPLAGILEKFYQSYDQAIRANGHSIEEYLPILNLFVDLVIKDLKEPYQFDVYHESRRSPIDYYKFGMDLLRPLVIFEKSFILAEERLEQISLQLEQGENVIFFANHQTEPDPQAISLLLEKKHPKFAEEMIFVAGHRVISDPLAIPFSLGRNLICIFSKKHIENPIELKNEKIHHNQRAMKMLGRLLAEGGKCIFVAPSGGRDRPDESGKVRVDPFDPQSIELFSLVARHSKKRTHFYPLALHTYSLLPPPGSVEKELGESRQAQCTPIHMAFGEEVAMDGFLAGEGLTKPEQRQMQADYIHGLVKKAYAQLEKL